MCFIKIFNKINKILLNLGDMPTVGFEPTHPEILGLKSNALNHSAISAIFHLPLYYNIYFFKYFFI